LRELLNIIELGNELHKKGESFCLATVIKIGGSTYRRPGARMLVSAEGKTVGTVSGGCLESEIALQSLDVIKDGNAKVIEFTLDEDDLIYGFGSGCNGMVRVLLQKIDPKDRLSVWPILQNVGLTRDTRLLATVVGPESHKSLGGHLLLDGQGLNGATPLPVFLVEPLVSNIEKAWDSFDGSETVALEIKEQQYRFFIEKILPPPRLLIFGEGVDANEVGRLASEMSWSSEIIGRKSAEEMKERLPHSDQHTFLMHPEESASTFVSDSRTAALVMNHNYVRDCSVLKALLKTDLPYIGVLGPRERAMQMLEEIKPGAKSFPKHVHAPMGVSIGSETPEEIALSILAEVQAVFNKKSAGFLKDEEGRIH